MSPPPTSEKRITSSKDFTREDDHLGKNALQAENSSRSSSSASKTNQPEEIENISSESPIKQIASLEADGSPQHSPHQHSKESEEQTFRQDLDKTSSSSKNSVRVAENPAEDTNLVKIESSSGNQEKESHIPERDNQETEVSTAERDSTNLPNDQLVDQSAELQEANTDNQNDFKHELKEPSIENESKTMLEKDGYLSDFDDEPTDKTSK